MQKHINTIFGLGLVIITTITSFIARPPVISSDENEGINWRNVVIFITGVLVIYFQRNVSTENIPAKKILIPGSIFILALIAYEIMYYKYSISCYNNRVIISYAEVRPEFKIDWKGWQKENNYENFLKGADCSPVNRWYQKDLAIQNYGFISLYIIITTSFIKTVLLSTYKIKSNAK
ncbi:hypothetical protein [Flavobacterium microcysteis]|uniref:Uncharacterized protein n=1 Tax=Flavobacterium microcysteis TaxID=2596891 RepID=A0A501QE89_9FLAO|nr:hypothetical protein [Flavobacterium microcysteis]TPD70535.1 hypothetical protein FJA49_06250 [Flavobacterium microcysteis]